MMNITGLQNWRRLISNYLRRDIYHVTDQREWVLYWIGHYVVEYLRQQHGVRASITPNVWNLHNQIIQFGDRYTYLHNDFRALHASNKIFLTWYHGEPDDPNPDMQKLFELLPQAEAYITKINVSCQRTKKVLLETGIPPEKLEIIPIGIDLKTFMPPSRTERETARRKFEIPPDAICIGSFQKDGQGWDGEGTEPKLVKGPDIFLETIAILAQHYPNLLIFLTGPARGYVKQGLDKIGVRYIHHLLDDYRDITRCYPALDYYLISSRTEGGPLGLMESWATGVPVVSTQMGMPADWIRHGENGMLADVEDAIGLADSLQTLIENADLRERCCHQALEDVKPLDWSCVADQYYAMYKPYLKSIL
ncbi:MAG TPA: glycosyltransferase family 4 protein [Aggregatilineales bacterium]|nr:glycosyltransferase family 4 protein [Aggregatilineales bacterium]